MSLVLILSELGLSELSELRTIDYGEEEVEQREGKGREGISVQ